MFGGNFAPLDWAMCDGQLLSIAQNEALFSIIGTTYGGDGVQTFGLPNLQGNIPMHWGTGSANASGLTINYGGTGGTTSVTMSSSNLPSHSHALVGGSGPATLADPTNASLSSPLRNAPPIYSTTATGLTPLAPTSITPTGGGIPFGRTQPYLVVNFIIALYGVFPSRN